MQPLVIPYKALSRCSIDELAAQQRANERRQQQYGGVMFARKVAHSEKDAARSAIVSLLTVEERPGPMTILTMPSLGWHFEAMVLREREPNWRATGALERTSFTCVENDRFIYYSATTKMPGMRLGTIRSLERPEYAERAMGNSVIDRFIFANVDDLLQSGEVFDAAWLDYTGPLNVERMRVIQRFWRDSVRDLLVITALKARWNKETGRVIERHGDCLGWLRARLPGAVVHEIEYQDGASPMVQFALRKA